MMSIMTSILAVIAGFTIASAEQLKCEQGVTDCAFLEAMGEPVENCAPYNGNYPVPADMTWVLIASSLVGALMAFGIGANDAANSWATAVGSGAIDVKYAVMIGGVFEWIGAVSLGAGVSKTIQKGVSQLTEESCWACGFCDSKMSVMMVGAFGALFGGGMFLLLASFTALPVSTTHSIVGGVVGMNLAGAGVHCLNIGSLGVWPPSGILGIVASWVLSPVFSGLVACCFYLLSKKYIIESGNARERAIWFTPFAYALASFIVFLLMMFKSKGLKKNVDMPWKFGISIILASIVFLVAYVFVMPKVIIALPGTTGKAGEELNKFRVEFAKKKKEKSETEEEDEELTTKNVEDGSTVDLGHAGTKGAADSSDDPTTTEDQLRDVEVQKYNPIGETGVDAMDEDQLDALHCFKYLLVFNAALESLAHGSNDTANATGPFAAVYETWNNGLYECGGAGSSWWILLVGGFFVMLGINFFGHRVMKTIGTDIVVIDYHRAYYIELGSTLATIVATNLEMPVSTTHCQIGAVLCVGIVSVGWKNVDFFVMSKVIMAWVMTIPIAGGFAAIVAAIARSVMGS